jgi:hypothetical protein
MKHHGDGIVQSVLLCKDMFTKDEAKHWIIEHGYKVSSPDTTNRYYRFRQENPKNLEAMHMRFRTISMGKAGDLIIAYR